MFSDLPPGTQLGQYRIEARIGEGGMAVVYRARHAVLGSLHAIKLLKAGGSAAQRLLREGRSQSRIRHPNGAQALHRDLWVTRTRVCGLAHPISGRIHTDRPTRWFLKDAP
jgi:serine/threonine protein kinase